MDITPLSLVLAVGSVALAIVGAGLGAVIAVIVMAVVIEAFVLGGRWAYGPDGPTESPGAGDEL